MHTLLDIHEDYPRDVLLHYQSAVLFNTSEKKFFVLDDATYEDEDMEELTLRLTDARKNPKAVSTTLEDIEDNWQAVSLADGYVNLNGYAILCERGIERRYRKSTTIRNTSVHVLGLAYSKIHKKRTKTYLDAYVCMKALKNKYYSFEEGMKKLQSGVMFSVALSPSVALVKAPDETVHLVYYDVYIAPVQQGKIMFTKPEYEHLLIDQIKELGYVS